MVFNWMEIAIFLLAAALALFFGHIWCATAFVTVAGLQIIGTLEATRHRKEP